MVDNEHAFRLLYGRDAPDDPELGAALRRVEETIAEAIDPLIDAGLDPEHRLLLAHAVVGMAEGASRHWLDARRRRTMPDGRAGHGGAASVEGRRAEAARWPPGWPISPGPGSARSTASEPGPGSADPDACRGQAVTSAGHHRCAGGLHHTAGVLGGDGEGADRRVAGHAEGDHPRVGAEQAERDGPAADHPPELIGPSAGRADRSPASTKPVPDVVRTTVTCRRPSSPSTAPGARTCLVDGGSRAACSARVRDGEPWRALT